MSKKKDGNAPMWKTGLWVVSVLLGWGVLSLACDVSPFDPRGYRCSSNADCLQTYTCVANVCELSVPIEGISEGGEATDAADAGDTTEGSEANTEASEPKPEASEPKPEASEPKPEASEPKPEVSESAPEAERVLESAKEGGE